MMAGPMMHYLELKDDGPRKRSRSTHTANLA